MLQESKMQGKELTLLLQETNTLNSMNTGNRMKRQKIFQLGSSTKTVLTYAAGTFTKCDATGRNSQPLLKILHMLENKSILS